MFISKLEKDRLNDRFDMLTNKCIEQEIRIDELEAIINTLTDLFSVEINQRVGKKCAELSKELSEKLGDAFRKIDKVLGKAIKKSENKTTKKVEPKTAPATKKVGRPKKETK